YLKNTGRPECASRTEIYFKAQNLWETDRKSIRYSDTLSLDMSTVEPSMSGPSRPQDRVPLSKVRSRFRHFLIDRHHESLDHYSKGKLDEWKEMSDSMKGISYEMQQFHPDNDLAPLNARVPVHFEDVDFHLIQGSIVIAAITSCTNTSN